jgi:hypothetical protein
MVSIAPLSSDTRAPEDYKLPRSRLWVVWFRRHLAAAAARRFVARRLVRLEGCAEIRDAEPSVAQGSPMISICPQIEIIEARPPHVGGTRPPRAWTPIESPQLRS